MTKKRDVRLKFMIITSDVSKITICASEEELDYKLAATKMFLNYLSNIFHGFSSDLFHPMDIYRLQ